MNIFHLHDVGKRSFLTARERERFWQISCSRNVYPVGLGLDHPDCKPSKDNNGNTYMPYCMKLDHKMPFNIQQCRHKCFLGGVILQNDVYNTSLQNSPPSELLYLSPSGRGRGKVYNRTGAQPFVPFFSFLLSMLFSEIPALKNDRMNSLWVQNPPNQA